jgi:hypothetical protein
VCLYTRNWQYEVETGRILFDALKKWRKADRERQHKKAAAFLRVSEMERNVVYIPRTSCCGALQDTV